MSVKRQTRHKDSLTVQGHVFYIWTTQISPSVAFPKTIQSNKDTLPILIMCESCFEEISEKCGQQQCPSYKEPPLDNFFQSENETHSQVLETPG